MKIYIANCSRQKHKFNYKVPEKTQQFFKLILAGQQAVIEDLPEVIHHIIGQHEPYGFLPANRLGDDFGGICYSIDKPVSIGQFNNGIEQKIENMDDMSQKILEASAASINHTIEQEVLKTGEIPRPGFELEIVGESVNQEQDNAPSLKKTVRVGK